MRQFFALQTESGMSCAVRTAFFLPLNSGFRPINSFRLIMMAMAAPTRRLCEAASGIFCKAVMVSAQLISGFLRTHLFRLIMTATGVRTLQSFVAESGTCSNQQTALQLLNSESPATYRLKRLICNSQQDKV